MSWFRVTVGNESFLARPASVPDEVADSRFATMLPTNFHLLHEQWSGSMVTTVERLDPGPYAQLHSVAFQQPGMIYVAQDDGSIVLCYGQGRLNDGFAPRRATPVAQVVERVEEFNELCRNIQFTGIADFRIEAVDEGKPEPAAVPNGPTLTLELGDIQATAVLLEDVSPSLVKTFVEALPAKGFATNTHSSGPLVRFWNETGGTEGETPLQIGENDAVPQAVLYYGYIYYMPKPGYRGLRIPGREATMMRSAARGGGGELYTLAKFATGLDDFSRVGRGLRESGSVPMRLSVS